MSFYHQYFLNNYRKLIIAYSGGIDSHCLLHMLAQDNTLRNRICAVHINHGINQQANEWAQHCQQVCDALQIPLQIFALDIKPIAGDSLEAIARTARYQALAELVKDEEALLTAHHLDDQAETMLLQLFRGAGVAGLAAMPTKKTFARGWHIRPLLEVTRKQLMQYAQQYQLNWLEDQSNQDSQFTRNYLRHKIMPILKEKWPSVAKTIARSSQHCAQTITLLQELAESDLQYCLLDDKVLSLPSFIKLSTARQVNTLRFWLQQLTNCYPDQNTLMTILHQLIKAKRDAKPELYWNGKIIRRFQQTLYCLPKQQKDLVKQEYDWDWKTPFVHHNFNLTANIKFGFGLDQKKLPLKLKIKFRSGGETIKPYKREQTHSLKKLFQEWNIPPWQRSNIPLIFAEEELIAVIGYCYHNDYMVTSDQQGVVLEKY